MLLVYLAITTQRPKYIVFSSCLGGLFLLIACNILVRTSNWIQLPRSGTIDSVQEVVARRPSVIKLYTSVLIIGQRDSISSVYAIIIVYTVVYMLGSHVGDWLLPPIS